MKVCLQNRQEAKYLKYADEIKVGFRDRRALPDMFEKYPEKDFILELYSDSEIEWNDIKEYNILSQGHLILCIANREQMNMCKEIDAKFYFGYPISSFYDLRAAVACGVCYVRLDAPIFFQLDKVKELGVPVRAVPNVAYLDFIPREDGVCGTWIRPEDLDDYAEYIEVIEFEDCDNRKEQALYRIYIEQKAWPGELNDIISNLNYNGTNRMIPPHTFGIKRAVCGQRCQETGRCKICYRTLDLANPTLLSEYRDAMNLS
jgi:hypothetical protein